MRFVVIGTSGAGKSTFARALASTVNCPYIELDSLHWGPAWTSVAAETFASSVRDATEADRWVADGNYSAIREMLWSRATHIVWLNLDRSTVLSRVFARTMHRILFRTQLWHGNRESFRATFFSKDSILLWALTTFSKNQHTFSELHQQAKYDHLQWVEITRPAQARAYISSLQRAAASTSSAFPT